MSRISNSIFFIVALYDPEIRRNHPKPVVELIRALEHQQVINQVSSKNSAVMYYAHRHLTRYAHRMIQIVMYASYLTPFQKQSLWDKRHNTGRSHIHYLMPWKQ